MAIPNVADWEAALSLFAAAVAGYLTGIVALRLIVWATTRADSPIGKSIASDLHGPLRLFFPVLFVRQATRYLLLPDQPWVPIFAHAVAILLIVATGWLLVGAVTIEVDYRTPVDQVRAAVGPMIEASKLWDRKFWNLLVVEAGPTTIRLRVLLTAADSSKAFDLRCEIREQLVGWLQQHHPDSLPRLRVETTEPSMAEIA